VEESGSSEKNNVEDEDEEEEDKVGSDAEDNEASSFDSY
jgi:hypothetical protein